jgi:putative nucleotidyltransferase with HDIG domain
MTAMTATDRRQWLRQRGADIYIWVHVLAGAAVLCETAANWQLRDRRQFFAYLITAIVASGLKVRLPGLKGTASVGFLFVFIGILDLSTHDAIVMVAVSMAVQCLWRAKQAPRPIRVCWSISSISVAVYASSMIYGWVRQFTAEPFALGVLATAFFAISTSSLAGVVALTEGKPFRKVMKQQAWLLPYYFCGTSVAWIIGTMPSAIQWQVPLICWPVVYIIHHSYAKHLAQIEQEKKHVEDMNGLHLRTIETLAVAIEARDHETHDHLARVQAYAVEIGRELGFDEMDLNALRAASLLHDIGKLAVPEQIISKPGRLTPAEFEKMKVHPIVGAEILERVAFPYPVSPIVRSHHEKWNGTGYPDGLKGEQIPLGARILSAVDCLDALASDRQYRRALPLDEAMAKIVSESGTSFDPKVVGVLQRRYRELEATAKANSQARRPGLSTDVRVDRGAAPAAGFAEASAPADLASLASNVEASAFRRQPCAATDLTREEALAVMAMRLQTVVPHDALAFFVTRGSALYTEYVGGAHGAIFRELVVPWGDGLVGWVAENQTPIINGNPAVEPGYPLSASYSLRSALTIPIATIDGTQGVLSLYRRDVEAFDVGDLSALHALCQRSGFRPAEAERVPASSIAVQ